MQKIFTKRKIAIAAIFLVVLGGWRWRSQTERNKSQADIKIVEVERKDLEKTLSVSGEVTADKLVDLNFPNTGILGFVKVKAGDRVKKGQVLMGLDTRDLTANQTRAWYTYLAADANTKQVEDEVKGHDDDETFVLKNSRVAAQAARDSAYEAWVVSQRAVYNAVLKSPFEGIVTRLTTSTAGDTVGIADGVSVVNPESLYFEIEIDESDLGKAGEGMEVKVKLDAYSGLVFVGKLTEIGFVSRLSSTGATVYPANIVFDLEVIDKLRLGMNGDAEIILGQVYGVLAVPIEAIVDGKVETEHGEIIEIETGLDSGTEVEVKSGLSEGDKLLIK